MGEREIRLLEQVYAEWGNGDYTRGDFLHPEVEMIFADDFLDTGTYHGVSEVWRGWKSWLDQWEKWHYHPTRYIELDDGRIVVFIDMRGVGRSTGVKLESDAGNIWEFEDGLVRRLTLYAHRENLLREVDIDPA